MLYNDLRPPRFRDVVGQPTAIGLRNAVKLKRVPSAILLQGARGTGKTTLARILARAVNCRNPKDGEPCLTCAQCKSDLDILESDVGAYNSPADMVTLKRWMNGVPQGNKRVVILDEVHALTEKSQTSFLKILEEPPANTIIILCTTDPESLLEAIKNRCSVWPVKPVTNTELGRYVLKVCKQYNLVIEKRALYWLVSESRGSIRDVLSLLDALRNYDNGNISESLVLSVVGLANTQKLVRYLKEGNLEKSLKEANRLGYSYSAKTVLYSVARMLMQDAVSNILEDAGSEEDTYRWLQIAALAYEARAIPVVDDLTHVQVTVVKALLKHDAVEEIGDSAVWNDFCESVKTGVELGFYPASVESDITLIGNVVVTGSKVTYEHYLNQEVSGAVVDAFKSFSRKSLKWRRHDYKTGNGTGTTSGSSVRPLHKGKRRIAAKHSN